MRMERGKIKLSSQQKINTCVHVCVSVQSIGVDVCVIRLNFYCITAHQSTKEVWRRRRREISEY